MRISDGSSDVCSSDLVVLIALAAKNTILIVEFAKQAEEDQGMDRFDAAVHAAGSRLRPILMTSFAFIFGVLPLAIAVGPGAEIRQALGQAVVFGMQIGRASGRARVCQYV